MTGALADSLREMGASGFGVAEALAARHPDQVSASYLTDVSQRHG